MPPPAVREHDLEHVVDRDHADEMVVLVGHRHDGRSKSAISRATSSSSASGRTGCTGRSSSTRRTSGRRGGAGSRSSRGGNVVFIVKTHAALSAATGEVRTRSTPPRRCLPVHADELGAHQAARGGRVVAEQRAHAPPLHALEQGDDALAALLVELQDEVGSIVASMRRAASRSARPCGLHELELVLVVELLEHVSLELGVGGPGGHDLLALVVRGRLDEIGELRRVQPRELRMRDAQAHASARGR